MSDSMRVSCANLLTTLDNIRKRYEIEAKINDNIDFIRQQQDETIELGKVKSHYKQLAEKATDPNQKAYYEAVVAEIENEIKTAGDEINNILIENKALGKQDTFEEAWSNSENLKVIK